MNAATAIDFLIIGGGVIGSFATLHLARAGHQVVLLERKVPGVEASGANAGSLGLQNKPLRLLRLSRTAVDAWQEFERETGLDAGYHRLGGFRVAETQDGVERLRSQASAQRALGVPVEHIDGDEARRSAPYLSHTVLAANYCAIDGHNNSLVATSLVAAAARTAGATVLSGVEARSVEWRPGSILVHTSAGKVQCERLILTAGVWSRDLLVDLDLNLPVVLRTQQMMVTEPSAPLIEHIVFHVDGHLTLKQVWPAASCLVGGGWPGDGSFRRYLKKTNQASTLGNAALAMRIVPALADLRVLRSWSGFDWRSPDGMPVLGEVPGRSGVLFCTSCFGGYTLSPILGRGLALAASAGELPAELQEFAPQDVVAAQPA